MEFWEGDLEIQIPETFFCGIEKSGGIGRWPQAEIVHSRRKRHYR